MVTEYYYCKKVTTNGTVVFEKNELIPKNKYDATTNPGVTNDIDEGYAPGSVWLNVTDDQCFVCMDNTDGAAVWRSVGGAFWEWDEATIEIDDRIATGHGVAATINALAYDPSVKTILNSRENFNRLDDTATGPEVGTAMVIARTLRENRVPGSDVKIRVHLIKAADASTGDADMVIGSIVRALTEDLSQDYATDVVSQVASDPITFSATVLEKIVAEYTLLHSADPMAAAAKLYVVIARNGEGVNDTLATGVFVDSVEIGHLVTAPGTPQ